MKVYVVYNYYYDYDAQTQEVVAIFDNKENAQHLCSMSGDAFEIKEVEVNKIPTFFYKIVVSKAGSITGFTTYLEDKRGERYSINKDSLVLNTYGGDINAAKSKALALYKKLITVKKIEEIEWKAEFLNTSGELPE
jgi:hypothetical protein